MANIFNSIPVSIPKKNRFHLNHLLKTTCEAGYVVPVLVQDVLPNDSFKLSLSSLVRLAPMLAPAMAEIDVRFYAYFVPNRLIWSQWETFITGSRDGLKVADSDLPQKPRFVFSGDNLNSAIDGTILGTLDNQTFLGHKSLADYLGFQTFNKGKTFSNGTYALDAMPFLAYQRIWYDWFRDENLQTDADFTKLVYPLSGDINWASTDQNRVAIYNSMILRRQAWRKDYFTSALPWSQKGDDVLIPGSSGNLVSNGDIPPFVAKNPASVSGTLSFTNKGGASPNNLIGLTGTQQGTTNPLDVYLNPAALSLDSASEGTIRELRRAFAAQKFLERRAIGGTRYQEQNLAFFGIRGSDSRLQRSEFLGGYKTPIIISQLLQTSESTQNSPLGTPAGNGVSAGGKYLFKRTFEEYGFIVVLMSIMPKPDYMSGIPKMYLKRDPYDYYWPQFARIGEQPIEYQELFFDPTNSAKNEGTFGYTPRYAEYRFRQNRVSGDFKDSLLFWTLAREFTSAPNLNYSFIECNPSNRIFSVEDTDYSHYWIELSFNLTALRPIPKYAESL